MSIAWFRDARRMGNVSLKGCIAVLWDVLTPAIRRNAPEATADAGTGNHLSKCNSSAARSGFMLLRTPRRDGVKEEENNDLL